MRREHVRRFERGYVLTKTGKGETGGKENMKVKKLLSGLTALAIAATSFAAMTLNVGAAVPDKVYIGNSVLNKGQFMKADGTLCEDTEHTVGEGDCTAHLSEDGVLTLGGTMTVSEVSTAGSGGAWGAIASDSNKDLVIELLPNADITLNTATHSGMYAYRAPITISGEGKLTINVSGGSTGGLVFYEQGNVIPHITITDGANVTITGTKGIAFDSGSGENGNIYVTDGGTLTVDVTGTSFSKAPVIEDYSTVTVGDSEEQAGYWDNNTSLVTYKYVKIKSLKHPSSIGIQTGKSTAATWLYNNHTYPYESDDPTIYYSEDTGVLEFYKDITLYGVTEAGNYYGTGIIPYPSAAGKDWSIKLNNGAKVTINATNRNADVYLYGIYSIGSLTIEGNGTLEIISNAGTLENAALRIYNNNYGNTMLTVKDDVKLILKNEDSNGYGLFMDGNGVKDINIQGNAAVEMIGGAKAINKAPVISGEQKIYAGENAESASEIELDAITNYKYVKITAEETTPAEIEAKQATLAFSGEEIDGITITDGEATADGETISAWSLTAADGISFANGGTVTATLNNNGGEKSAEFAGFGDASVDAETKVFVLVNRPFADVQSVIFTPNAQ